MSEDVIGANLTVTGMTSKAGVVVFGVGVNHPVVVVYRSETGGTSGRHLNIKLENVI